VQEYFKSLSQKLEGELELDDLHKKLYATDASVYKMLPLAVAYPKNSKDLKLLIQFAKKHNTSLIPRTAGTSLAGQCVGEGIVVDVSKHFTKIIELNTQENTVRVQPGVNRDALNAYLKPFNLFFGPNTSTSAYCMMGGMVGNNSSGTTSIRYGVTRDQVVELETILSDGSHVIFKTLNNEEFIDKTEESSLEGRIYAYFYQTLSDKAVQQEILQEFPEASVHRRNTGYALDALIKQKPFNSNGSDFNLSKLLTGSEGTLAFTTSITLQLEPLPPKATVILALHFESISKAMKAVVPVMQHQLFTCELIDKTILDCTKEHPGYQQHREFIEGDPKAILLLELRDESFDSLKKQLINLQKTVESTQLSYAAVQLWDTEIEKANELRHAGLGLLGNLVGDKKAVACIEDTAVPLEKLADYIEDFQGLMKKFDQEVVYYAHAGAGELHLRPILNLKTQKGKQDFRAITLAVAHLVKKYKGALSGEHGDGIVRSEFIPLMVGAKNYSLFKEIKRLFDPHKIFNPGKIVDSLPMDQNLRTESEKTPVFDTAFDFSSDQGLLRAAEKCNGAGKCRSVSPQGTMCPSYRATRDEKHNTRGRANVLREVLTQNKTPNAFDSRELKEVFDLCLSCKACATECPSSVDVATYKAEFLYHYQKTNGSALRDKLFAYFGKINQLTQPFRAVQNALFNQNTTRKLVAFLLRIQPKRSLPKLEKSLYKQLNNNELTKGSKSVYLYLDEFSNYNETHIGKAAVELLRGLGYQVKFLSPTESGRTYISKGFLDQARQCADHNISLYSKLITEDTPLLGIEPSAIYTFQDEYPKLSSFPEASRLLASNCMLVETFIAKEIEAGVIQSEYFHTDTKEIKIHAHCYQKALGKPFETFQMLNLPINYTVTFLNTGCCGMAGSFGYEKEHYEVSMKVGEERLFPAVRKANSETVIAANGTSCRHQIQEGTGRVSLHPISILHDALIKKSNS
jgi:FAD/FMN-containing dehydrogenase/Fe-S oxidoreductase